MTNNAIYVAKSYVSGEAFARGMARGAELGFMIPEPILNIDYYPFIVINSEEPADMEYGNETDVDQTGAVRVYSEDAVMAFFDEYEAELPENVGEDSCADCEDEGCFLNPEYEVAEVVEPIEDSEDEVTEDLNGNNIVTIESPLANIDIATEDATLAVDVREDIIKIRIGCEI